MKATTFSKAQRQRLNTELILWLTTVTPSGQPQSHPVWFVLDGDDILMWSKEGKRSRNLETNNRVSAHVNDDGKGSKVLTIEGTATIEPELGPGSDHSEFVRRYQGLSGGKWGWFDGTYNIAVRITPSVIRGSS